MKISHMQMAVFERETNKTFALQIAESLRHDYPRIIQELSEDAIHHWVQHGVKQARSYGLRVRANIAAYVTLMFVIAPNFDQTIDFSACLTALGAAPDAAFEWLLNETTDTEWLEMRAVWLAQLEGTQP